MLRVNRDETINPIISECSKLANTRHDWVGKMILWELCKKLKCDHTTMHKLKSVLENEKNKILWDTGIQTNQLTPVKILDLDIIYEKKKKTEKLSYCRLCHSG